MWILENIGSFVQNSNSLSWIMPEEKVMPEEVEAVRAGRLVARSIYPAATTLIERHHACGYLMRQLVNF
jgi:hypothetical protein